MTQHERSDIYLSSTSKDLDLYRQSAIQSINNLGYHHVAMEDYGAVDDDAVNKCLSDVRTSDAYVGILAWRYGYIPEGFEQSITELEYREAVKYGKPRFLFLLHEDTPWPRSFMDNPDDKIVAFREDISKERIVAFFDSEDSLARAVTAALAKWQPKVESIPYQLRPAIRDFVGRETEIEELVNAVSQQGATIVSVRGMGGVGKTELALKVAETLEASYTNGRIFLDLRGYTQSPRTVEEIMLYIIQTLDPDSELKQNESQLQSTYFSVLHEKRILLFFDNANDRWQIEPLIPPESCLLIVTTRQHFVLPGLVSIEIDPMSESEAESMLLGIAPRIGEYHSQISSLCGYLPLALRLAAGVLAERPDIQLEQYVSRLEEAHYRLGLTDGTRSIDATIELSYELLRNEFQNLFILLAIFKGSFDTLAVEAVWKVDSDISESAIGQIYRYSLIQWDSITSRFYLHDLIRDFADVRLTGERRDHAQRRHADHYRNVIFELNSLYEKGGDNQIQSIRSFDKDWQNVRAAFTWSKSQQDARASQLCSDYLRFGQGLLNIRQRPRENIRWLESAIDASRRINDKHSECLHLNNLARIHLRLHYPKKALEKFDQSWLIAQDIKDVHLSGIAIGGMGLANVYLGNVMIALEETRLFMLIAEEIGNIRYEAAALCNLGLAFSKSGDLWLAIDHFGSSLSVLRDIGDFQSSARCLSNLGAAYVALGYLEQANDFFGQQLEISRLLGDHYGQSEALANLSRVYQRMQKTTIADELLSQCRQVLREIVDQDDSLLSKPVTQQTGNSTLILPNMDHNESSDSEPKELQGGQHKPADGQTRLILPGQTDQKEIGDIHLWLPSDF